jgi:hypothetical protein
VSGAGLAAANRPGPHRRGTSASISAWM